MSPHVLQVLPSAAALPDFGISEHGFLPSAIPLQRLSDPYYEPWETLIRLLPELLKADTFRKHVDQLQPLDVSLLSNEAEWQRAYSILAIMAQGYIWGGDQPSEVSRSKQYKVVFRSILTMWQRLPPGISVPFLAVASYLEVPPVATYAALNLCNWRPVFEGADLRQPENLGALHTLSGTVDESWFYVISNAMEARATPMIEMMLSAIEAVNRSDTTTVIQSLDRLCVDLASIARLLERMDERCDPFVFYHHIRPYLAGSQNMEAAGLPRGVFYDQGNGKGSWRKYRGGSNGQSSLIQFFDTILGVSHKSSTFHQEMRTYMHRPHARFLEDLEAVANIRQYIEAHPEQRDLVSSYNAAIASLGSFRDSHIRLVTRYIILPSRQIDPQRSKPRVQNLAAATSELALNSDQSQAYVGTGGSKLVPFLRSSRDETLATRVGVDV